MTSYVDSLIPIKAHLKPPSAATKTPALSVQISSHMSSQGAKGSALSDNLEMKHPWQRTASSALQAQRDNPCSTNKVFCLSE